LRRIFGEEVVCPGCGGRLRLVAKAEETVRSILSAMHLPMGPTGPPKETKPMSPDAHKEELELSDSGAGEGTDWPEYPE